MTDKIIKRRPAQAGDVLATRDLPGGGRATILVGDAPPPPRSGSWWEESPPNLPHAVLRLALPCERSGKLSEALRCSQSVLGYTMLPSWGGLADAPDGYRQRTPVFTGHTLSEAVQSAEAALSEAEATLQGIVSAREEMLQRRELAIERSLGSVTVTESVSARPLPLKAQKLPEDEDDED